MLRKRYNVPGKSGEDVVSEEREAEKDGSSEGNKRKLQNISKHGAG